MPSSGSALDTATLRKNAKRIAQQMEEEEESDDEDKRKDKKLVFLSRSVLQ